MNFDFYAKLFKVFFFFQVSIILVNLTWIQQIKIHCGIYHEYERREPNHCALKPLIAPNNSPINLCLHILIGAPSQIN